MAFRADRSRATEPLFYKAPHPDDHEPMGFQFAGAEFSLAREHSLIGDEPGLGKTIQAILIDNAIKAQRTLAVVPASLRLNWEREALAWTTGEPTTYPILKAKDGVSSQAHWVIISYDLLRNADVLDVLCSEQWDHLILDEAHYLKDPKGNARTMAITASDGLRNYADRITALSGTIMPNQPIECYNVIRMLDWGALDEMSIDAFRDHFYTEGEGFVNVWDPVEEKWKSEFRTNVKNVPINVRELQGRLRSGPMIRRLKDQVLTQLPAKTYQPIPLISTPGIRQALKHDGWRQVERMLDLDPDSFELDAPIDGAVSTARRELGEAKAPVVAAYIRELLDEGVDKVLVGFWHKSVADILEAELSEFGLVKIDGRSSMNHRQWAVDQFQTEAGVRVFLGQLRSAGVGFTLTAASHVVFAEADWVPGTNEQFIDRLHRIGQLYAVFAHFPIIPGSAEERIIGRAIEKARVIHEALDAEG